MVKNKKRFYTNTDNQHKYVCSRIEKELSPHHTNTFISFLKRQIYCLASLKTPLIKSHSLHAMHFTKRVMTPHCDSKPHTICLASKTKR